MQTSRKLRAIVKPGGRIEVFAPDLAAGQMVEVTIASVPEQPERQALREILARVDGHQSFHTPAEVEAYLNAERDSWDQ